MASAQPRSSMWRWIVIVATVVVTLEAITVLMIGGENFSISVQNYGFPLTFLRVYRLGPVVPLASILSDPSAPRQFFPNALAFDLLVAVLEIVSFGFCIFRWSRGWSSRRCMSIAAAYVGFGLLLPLAPWMPLPITLLLLIGLLVVSPILPACCIANIAWRTAKPYLGSDGALVAPASVAVALVALGWSCFPHDIFSGGATRNDIPLLLRHLSDGDPEFRGLALNGLRRLAPYDDATAAAIIKAMSDPDESVSSAALSLAPDLGPRSVDAVPVLVDMLAQGADPTFELASMGPVARAAVPILKEKLATSSDYFKLGICRALWSIEGNTELVVPALIELLDDDFGPIQRDAAELLGRIGPAAAPAVPRLKQMAAYVPKPDPPQPPQPATHGVPAPRQMTEAEFYPQISAAAKDALNAIQRPVQPTRTKKPRDSDNR